MRVLIIKVSSLGDVIHTLPAVTDAQRAVRDLVFDWVVEENFTEVPSWHPAVETVIPVAIRRWRRNWIKSYMDGEIGRFKTHLQNIHYDLVIDAQGLIKSGILSRMSKGLTIGLSNRTIKEPMATLFYNKVYTVPWTEHAVDRVRQLFAASFGYRYDKHFVDYGLDLSRIGIKRNTLRQKQLVFLHGTTWHTKYWPDNYWKRLAVLATESGRRVLLPWGDEAERQRAERIATASADIEVLPRQSLTGLARHIAASEGVIAVDTGLGHLAAALATPTLSLYGPTDPGLSGTFGERQLHMQSGFACSPCMKKTCAYHGPQIFDSCGDERFPVTPACFSTLTPEKVWARFSKHVIDPVAK